MRQHALAHIAAAADKQRFVTVAVKHIDAVAFRQIVHDGGVDTGWHHRLARQILNRGVDGGDGMIALGGIQKLLQQQRIGERTVAFAGHAQAVARHQRIQTVFVFVRIKLARQFDRTQHARAKTQPQPLEFLL